MIKKNILAGSGVENLIPEDYYICIITKTQQKDLKSGKGKFLEIEFKIANGFFSGRLLIDRCILSYPSNHMVARVGLCKLSSLAYGADIDIIQDDEELIGRVVAVKTIIVKNEKLGFFTEISKIFSPIKMEYCARIFSPEVVKKPKKKKKVRK